MNIQTLKSKLTKGQSDLTKKVVVVVDNKVYEIAVVTDTPLKTILTTVETEEELNVPEPVETVKEVEARAYAGNDPVIEEAEEELAEETEKDED